MLVPAPSAAFVQIGEDVIVFDTASDRYLGLPGAASDGDRSATLVDRLSADARDALSAAGLLVEGEHEPPVLEKCYRGLAGTLPDAHLGFLDFRAFIIAALRARYALSRGRASSRYSRERLSIAADGALVEDLARLERLLLWLPVSHRCLPRSLTSALFLRGRGHDVDLVFGVRTNPFEAHCWLEQGGILLNDELDHVRTYSPIVVGRIW